MPCQKEKAGCKNQHEDGKQKTAHSLPNTLGGFRLHATGLISMKGPRHPKPLPRHDFCALHHALSPVAQA
jgi:hypothetical protein